MAISKFLWNQKCLAVFQDLFFSIHSPIDPAPSPVVLNEVTTNISNSQAPPAPEADTSYSQGNSNVIYEDVVELTPQIEAGQNYILTKCPAYEPHQPKQHKDHHLRRIAS